jgi:GH25 family lysozyme M1 (1,4-beta-N-acetylmuramidase)
MTWILGIAALLAGALVAATPSYAAGVVYGMDVSSYQGNVDWGSAAANGAQFAYIKATEGTGYTNAYFAQQYNGSYNAGLIRGAYHFALPDNSGGATQADYFVDHGGGWSNDGKTLPGALDIEYNPYGATCYGLSQSAMVSWISAFSTEYRARTGVYPTIYSTTDWWTTCTGNSSAFGSTNPLWLARYSSSAGTLPAGWSYYTFWQNADSGTFPGDQDQFNGDYSQLQRIACAC